MSQSGRSHSQCLSNSATRLRLGPGLLSEDDNGATDLGELEKKLAEKTRQASMTTASNPTSPSQVPSAAEGAHSTPQSALTSPEPGRESHKDDKRKSITPAEDSQEEEEVEALSEMMCSLVTNQCGETRYIGMQRCRQHLKLETLII